MSDATHEVMVLTPSNVADYIQVTTDSTVTELVASLVDSGKLSDPLDVAVLDGSSEQLTGSTVITEDVDTLNFIVKLAGA